MLERRLVFVFFFSVFCFLSRLDFSSQMRLDVHMN